MAQVLPVIDERREGTCSSHIFDGIPTPTAVHTLASKFLLWATSTGMGFSLRARESCVPGMSSVPCRFLGFYCQSLFSSSCVFATVN